MAEPTNPELNHSVTRRAVLSEMPTILDSEQSLTNFRERSGTSVSTSDTSTSSLSPDELVIQRRGRRHIPIVFSPDIDIIKQSNVVSQTQLDSFGHNKSSIVLESTPRKRLFCEPETPSPEMYANGLPNPKRIRYLPKIELPKDVSLLSAMQALTSDQLIGIISQIVDDHSDIEQEIRSHFPLPDVKQFEERIISLRRNINRSLPSSRLFSKTDSSYYSKVSLHILEFKKYVIDQGRRLIESRQWPIVMNYVFMAWEHVRFTPMWENPSHNTSRKQCFKSLSEICAIALKNMKETLDKETTQMYINQLEILCFDSKDIEPCLECLNPK